VEFIMLNGGVERIVIGTVDRNTNTISVGAGQGMLVVTMPRPSPWITSAGWDLALFVATPVVILPLIFLTLQYAGPSQLDLYVAAFGALGHHLPGMMRAYGDRALFARYKVRFTIAPVFLVAVCLCFAFTGEPRMTMLLVYLWSVWHAAMQTHGFLRIYDTKRNSTARVTAILDQAACLSWFATAFLLSPTRVIYVLEGLYQAGVPKIPLPAILWVQHGVMALTATITLAYFVNAIAGWRAGRPPSPVKILLLATTVSFFWYTNVTVPNLLVGIVMFELFHDVQYLAIVWLFNRRRAETDPGAGAFTRLVFGRGRAMVFLYLGLILAYGSLGLGRQVLPSEFSIQLLTGILTASTLLHFYYDGFIWKMRERETRASLGIAGGREFARRSEGIPPWLVHGAKWSLIVVPVFLFTLGWQTKGMDANERTLALAEVSPDVPEVQFNLGNTLESRGDLEGAIAANRKVLSLDPMDPETRRKAATNLTWWLVELAQRKIASGSPEEAIPLLREAHALNVELPAILVRKGMDQEKQGKPAEAQLHYRAALVVDPRNAPAHVRSAALAGKRGDWKAALDHVRRARDSHPGNPNVVRFAEEVEAAASEARSSASVP
jgi:tetratricopeptide (TPR) repeat protein